MGNAYLYTDGGCRGNPGIGAWAYAIIMNETILVQDVGAVEFTTNNKMELQAVIQGLQVAKEHNISELYICTDSQYVKNGLTKWSHAWQRNGWKTANKTPVKNKELWQELLALTKQFQLTWQWVQGHSENKWNNYCDALLNTCMDTM